MSEKQKADKEVVWRLLLLSIVILWFVGVFVREIIAMFSAPFDMGLMVMLGSNLIAFIAFCGISLFVMAQFVLPTTTWKERLGAAKHLILFVFGRYGPAIFVKGGKLVERRNERKKKGAGVAIVDMSSVIVLGKRPDKLPKQTGHWDRGEASFEVDHQIRGRHFSHRDQKNEEGGAFVRIAGPGFVFIKSTEEIVNSFDLRTQSRNQKEITAHTSDGIEITTNVSVKFSISTPPEIVNVAFFGGRDIEHLKGVKLFEDKENDSIVIEDNFILNSEDAVAIFKKLQFDSGRPKNNAPVSRIENIYPYDTKRIRRIAYLKPWVDKDEAESDWTSLPIQVAVSVFRRMLSTYRYDDLYMLDESNTFPLDDRFRRLFLQEVKSQGYIAYQFIRRKDGKPLRNLEGEILDAGRIEKSVIDITDADGINKILRRYGISILSASFGDLFAHPDIKMRIIEKWTARWEREIKLIEAQHELAGMRVFNATRARMQREMTYLLSNIFQASPHSDEALALRAFQALETAAAAGGDHISPKEILLTLQNLHQWLLDEKTDGELAIGDMDSNDLQDKNHEI